ncbi:GNAT family N-acetyltransferase [Bacillus sp. B190/17]|uniref:GNAT family N-acetyltransferase n=1 Tax=Bacillus lumedeiriae TaxID=3058829 RepID=A0ABW8IC18_9BACI
MSTTESIICKQLEELKDIQEMVSFQEEIWGRGSAVPITQLIAASHHGGLLLGAFHQDQLVGGLYSFPGYHNQDVYLYSHMAAVHPNYQNAGIGSKLKLKQREWAMQYGYKKIMWTFDPLQARNSHFNLNKLGAYVNTYIPSYYGEMNDKLNKGLPSDRFLAEWDICSQRVEKALAGTLHSETAEKNYSLLFNYEEHHELPVPLNVNIVSGEDGYLIPVPADIHHLKQVDIEIAKKWRYELRNHITEWLSKGYKVTGIIRNSSQSVHYYVIENEKKADIYD